MKLTIDRAALLRALEPAQRVVERRNTIPVIGNLRLVAADGRLTVTGTDLDMDLRVEVPADVAKAGGTTASAARLFDIVRKLPDVAVTLEQAETGGPMVIRAGRSRFSLQTLPTEDFPDITVGELPHRFTLGAPLLAETIRNTSFAISTEEMRFYLNGIFLHVAAMEGGSRLAAVATDGHRLSRTKLAMPDGAEGIPGVIVPRKTVAEIARLIDKHKDAVTIELSQTKIRVTVDHAVLTSKLIDGTFPDYQRVIPTGNDKRLTVETKALAEAADRVATISGERGRAVKLTLAGNLLTLSVTNPDSGEAREELTCDYAGPAMEIGFNARYLAEVLAVLAGDTVIFDLAEPGAPTILRTREDSPLLVVLMPMRV